MTQYLEDTVRYSFLKKYLRYDTDTRYRYFYRVLASFGSIHLIKTYVIVNCEFIYELTE